MRRAAIVPVLALLVGVAVPAPAVANAEVTINSEARNGAQAGFDTGVRDAQGVLVPGSYVFVSVMIDVSSYVRDGDRTVSRERTLSVSMSPYEVDEHGSARYSGLWSGSTQDAVITLDPGLRSGSATGTVEMKECQYLHVPPVCVDHGTFEISVEFTAAGQSAPLPANFNIPGSYGYVWAHHGVIINRPLTATASLDGTPLGTSTWGNSSTCAREGPGFRCRSTDDDGRATPRDGAEALPPGVSWGARNRARGGLAERSRSHTMRAMDHTLHPLQQHYVTDGGISWGLSLVPVEPTALGPEYTPYARGPSVATCGDPPPNSNPRSHVRPPSAERTHEPGSLCSRGDSSYS